MNAFVQRGRGNEGLPAQVDKLSLYPVFDSSVDLRSSEIEWMIRGHNPAPGVCKGWNMSCVSLNIFEDVPKGVVNR
uniref:ACL5 n=1 Tax=Arundo donax TaxID=35708 RepID=A0A0A9D2Z8_ARUDO